MKTHKDLDIELAKLEHNLTNHPPANDHTIGIIEHIRAHAKTLGVAILTTCPPSRERSIAITQLEQTAMWAIAAIARHQPPAATAAPALTPAEASEAIAALEQQCHEHPTGYAITGNDGLWLINQLRALTATLSTPTRTITNPAQLEQIAIDAGALIVAGPRQSGRTALALNWLADATANRILVVPNEQMRAAIFAHPGCIVDFRHRIFTAQGLVARVLVGNHELGVDDLDLCDLDDVHPYAHLIRFATTLAPAG